MQKAEVVIILGMHRSGTSCLAGSLQASGLFLGSVNTKAPHNRKGNREHLSVMQLNDQVLGNTGHVWHDPPAADAHWTTADRRERDSIVKELSGHAPWGFKDPRTLFTLRGWLEVLPDAKLVGTLRHPLKVATSLASRGGVLHIPPDRGIALWRRYNERLLAFKQEFDFPLVDFDETSADYQSKILTLNQILGLKDQKRTEFFDEDLRQSGDHSGVPVDQQTLEIYETLRDMCL